MGLQFDLIWLSAVWMHVPPADRPRAFRKMVSLLKPAGWIMLSLRHGHSVTEERHMALAPVRWISSHSNMDLLSGVCANRRIDLGAPTCDGNGMLAVAG